MITRWPMKMPGSLPALAATGVVAVADCMKECA